MPREIRDLILGTMKSAKSAHLIMKGYLLDKQGKKVLTFKPEMDSRDGAFVTSRALPIKRPAIVIPKDDDGELLEREIWNNMPNVVLLDELQFFTVKQVERLGSISTIYDIDIYAYGLLMSYNGEMFKSIQKMIECGFKIKTLDMSCDYCNNDATHHLLYIDGKVVKSGEPIHVGDQEYKSVCYKCYLEGVETQ